MVLPGFGLMKKVAKRFSPKQAVKDVKSVGRVMMGKSNKKPGVFTQMARKATKDLPGEM